MEPLFTIGHSTRTLDEFVQLLRNSSVTAVCDVRSAPYSRFSPHFNRDPLAGFLKSNGINYVFLGKELGGRPEDPTCYENGKVQYEEVINTRFFQNGIDRLKTGLQSHRIGLMCAERDPLTCHRTILIARFLRATCDIHHIIDSQNTETHHEAEKRLLRSLGIAENNLFLDFDELVADAYAIQGRRIAYQLETNESIEQQEVQRR